MNISIRDNISRVPIDSLRPNEWNPNVQSEFIFEKEKISIQDHGFLDPIDVRETESGLEIVDGEHRWRAAKELGMSEVPINNLGNVPREVAIELTIIRNETRGQANKEKLGLALLQMKQKVSTDHLYRALPIPEVEIDYLLENSKIDWDKIKDEVEEKKKKSASEEGWETLVLRLPIEVMDQFKEQIDRFKKHLHPEQDDLSEIPIVQPVEFIVQTVAQIPDEQIFGQ